MTSLTVVIDPAGRHAASTQTLIVDSPASYWSAWRQIYSVLESAGDFGDVCVVVRHPAMLQRFDSLRTDPNVAFHVRSARGDLQDGLGRELPADLTDEDVSILQLDELVMGAPPRHDESAVDWIVRHRLGEQWTIGEAETPDMPDAVLSLANSARWLKSQWLMTFTENRLRAWATNDGKHETVWKFLQSAPLIRAIALGGYAAVRRYPRPMRKQWLGNWWSASEIDAFEGADEAASQFGRSRAPEELRTDIERGVRSYLTKRIEDGANLDQLVSYITGSVVSEVPIVARSLAQEPGSVTRHLVDAISLAAGPNDAAHVRRLEKLVPVSPPPPVPTALGVGDLDGVKRWFASSYLPWYYSLRHRSQVAPEQDAVCAEFATWLRDVYPSLLRDGKHTVLRLVDRIDELIAAGRRVLLIVIDGLGAEWLDLLVQLGKEQGLTVTGRDLLVTLLPTMTFICKPAILRGTPPAFASDGPVSSISDYQRLVDRHGGRFVDGASLAGDWQDSGLDEFLQREPRGLWVYLINRLDASIVHEAMSLDDRNARIETTLRDVILSATRAGESSANIWGQRPTILITSDHGYTTPGPGHGILPELGGVQVGTRCMRLSEDASVNLSDGWLHLDPPADFGLKVPYALALGNRFVTDIGLRAAHGGANPEEVFVPYVEFDGLPATLQAPVITFLANIDSDQERQDAILRVRNPNLSPIGRIRLESALFEDAVSVSVPIDPLGQITVPVAIVGGPHPPGALLVPIRIRFWDESQGRQVAGSADVIASVSRPLQTEAENKDDFEAMFDD